MDVTKLVLRYLVTRRIAVVAVLSIAVAVCAMIVVSSVMDGFQQRIREHMRGTQPDLSIRWRAEPPPLEHAARIEEELRGAMISAGGPIVALAPRMVSVGLIATRLGGAVGPVGEDRYFGVRICGIDWEREQEVVPLAQIIDVVDHPQYRLETPMSADPLKAAVPGVLVGKSLALRLGLQTTRRFGAADEAVLICGRARRDEKGETYFDGANLRFRVVGCYDSGRPDYDLGHVYISREAFRTLRYGGDATRPDAAEVSARLAPGNDVDTVSAELARNHPGLIFETWKDRNRKLLEAIKVEKRMMSLVLSFIIIVALSMLMGLLYMMVVEKTRDIGILRSMGMGRARVLAVFMSYGVCLGFLGAALGVILGVQVVTHLGAITDWLAETLGIEIFSRRLYRFDHLPAILDRHQVTLVALLTAGLALVAGAVGAFRASRLDPVACLRYE